MVVGRIPRPLTLLFPVCWSNSKRYFGKGGAVSWAPTTLLRLACPFLRGATHRVNSLWDRTNDRFPYPVLTDWASLAMVAWCLAGTYDIET